jgi:hypothetical protein
MAPLTRSHPGSLADPVAGQLDQATGQPPQVLSVTRPPSAGSEKLSSPVST